MKDEAGKDTASKEKAKKSKKWFARIGGIGLFLIIGFLAGYFGGMALGNAAETSSGGDNKLLILHIILGVAGVYVGVMLQIAVHEAGHLVCGLISGYTFESYRFGSLMIVKKEGKLRLKRYSLAGTGGQCLMTPPSPYREDIPVLLYNFGGCIANLILSGIALILFFVASDPILRVFFLFLSVIGVLFALTNGIPLSSGKLNNDGSNAMELRRNAAARKVFWAQMQMNGALTKEIRLKDMPEEWFWIPEREERQNAISASAAVFALSRAMDQLDFAEAERIAEEILAYPGALIGIHRLMAEAELLYCRLLKKHGYSGAEGMMAAGEMPEEAVENGAAQEELCMTKELTKFLKAAAALPSVPRLQYAYALLEKGDTAAAEKYLAAFEKIAAHYPHACEIEGERELIACAKETREKSRIGMEHEDGE